MRALRIAGFAAFFLFSFLVSIYLTFPWDAVKDRVTAAASEASGMEIHADRLRPSWLTGIIAEGVEIRTDPNQAEPIAIDRLSARAHVLALLTGGTGVSLSLPIARGEVDASMSQSTAVTQIDAEASGLELALVPGLADVTGLPLLGSLDLKFNVDLNDEDPTKTSGTIEIRAQGLEVGQGGKLGNVPVPELALGNLDWTIPIQEGRARLENAAITGGDVEARLDGEITLQQNIERSNLNVTVAFKPTPEFLKREALLGALLNNIRNARQPDGFYAYCFQGGIKRPRQRMGPCRR